MTGLQF